MSYKQIKQYGYRDNLESGDPEKVIYGADFDGEFNAIEVAMEKIVGGDMDVDIDDVDGLQAALDDKADKSALDDKADKTDLDDKADLDHTHEIDDVDGLQDALDALVVGDIEFPDVLTEVCEGLTIGGGTAVFDLEKANNFTLTHSGNFTASFTNPPDDPGAVGFTLQLSQPTPAAGNTITWPASVAWASGTAPTLSTGDGAVDVFTFFTTDGGVTYYGFTAGQGMA
jgi:hypothetical protein